MSQELRAPLVGLGNKHQVTDLIWQRFGSVNAYIEPFAYTASVALANPAPSRLKHEIINDHNGFVTNFWRSIKYSYNETAFYSDMPLSTLDFVASERRLLHDYPDLVDKLREDIHYHDPIPVSYTHLTLPTICSV